jgi:hypothetical protein
MQVPGYGLLLFGLALAAAAEAVDPNSLRLVERPAGAVEMTWQDATPSSYCVLRDAVCPPAVVAGSGTGLSYVDTPPAAVPLWHYAVSESTACWPSACAPAAALDCEAVRVAGNNAAPGSSSGVSAYPGCGLTGLGGAEFAYTFAPGQDLDLDLALEAPGADLDVLVLDDGGACDPARCVVAGDRAASLRVRGGSTYTVVVDGRGGAAGDYTLDIACAGTACTPAATVACGEAVAGGNGGPGSGNVLRDYSPCGLSGLTGPERVYAFTAPADGAVTAALGGLTADLDLAVLEDRGQGCLATECLDGGDASVRFTAVAGRTYYLVVDGRDGAAGDFDLLVTCAAATCTSAGTLVCGSPVFGRTDDPGSTDGVDGYACGPADASGPEYVYTYIASGTGDVTFRLSGSTQGAADVYVLDAARGCDGAACIAWGDSETTVPVVAGETYYLAVDGPAAAGYNLSTSCDFPPGVCRPVQPLACGDAVFGDTRSALATDANDVYPCAASDQSGPEFTYEFAPPDRLGDYLVSLTLLPQDEELDVFVLRNEGSGCNPAGCVAWGDAGLDFTAQASSQYYVAVDGRAGAGGGFQLLARCVAAPGQCQPAQAIGCGDVLVGRSNGGPGSTDVIDAYPTCPQIVFDETGPEYAYRFDAAADREVTVTLTNLAGGTAHLFVLEERGQGCDVDGCVVKGTTQVRFAARAGATYYIVTDGFNGAVATFDLAVSCS